MKHVLLGFCFILSLSACQKSTTGAASSTAIGSVSVSGPATTNNNTCSTVFTATILDTGSTAYVVPATATLTALGTLFSGILYSNSGCTTPLASLTVSTGNSAVSFYIKPTIAGSYTTTNELVTISGATSIVPENFSLTVN